MDRENEEGDRGRGVGRGEGRVEGPAKSGRSPFHE